MMWNNLASHFATVALTHEDGEFWWNLDSTGVFLVKSYYQGLIYQNVPSANKGLWKLKIPLKIKVLLWYLKRGVILTKDNLTPNSQNLGLTGDPKLSVQRRT